MLESDSAAAIELTAQGTGIILLQANDGSAGISITDNGSAGITITDTGTGPITINSAGSFVAIEALSGAVGINGATLGFYGVTGVARQSSAGITTVAQLVTALKNLGLLS